MSPVGSLTVISKEAGQFGKRYSLGKAGELVKDTLGEMTSGSYRVTDFKDVRGFAAILKELQKHESISTSVPLDGSREGRIVTKADLKSHPGAKARSKDYFGFRAGVGGFLLDADAPPTGPVMSLQELRALVVTEVPALASAGCVGWASGSSHIWHGDRELQGLRGQHLYFLIADVSDTERLMRVIAQRLWLAGYGRIDVSSSGAMLVRGVFDESVAQPSRLIFSAGSVCEPPLEQRRGEPVILCDGGFVDSRLIPDLTAAEEARYTALAEAAKAAKEPEALAKREAWKAARIEAGVGRLVKAGVSVAEAHERSRRNVESAQAGVLMGDWVFELDDGTHITGGEALDNPDKFNGRGCKDPIEPEFQSGKVCAKLFLYGAVPTVHSFARGGRTFKLRRQPARIYLSKGRKSETALEVLNRLLDFPDLYLRSGAMVQVVAGDVVVLDKHRLAFEVGLRIAFYTKGKDNDLPADIGSDVIEMVMAAAKTMNIKNITAVSLLPYPRLDGTLCLKPGYDSETGIYSHFDADLIPDIPDAPTPSQVIDALKAVWGPWSAYDLATDEDRGAMLAGVVSAVCRPVLPICPGWFMDSYTQAAGKTRAAGALGCVMTGRRGGVLPYVSGGNQEAEMSKKLVSVVREGDGFICIDNVVGVWGSAVMASLITDGVLSDRVLGSSTWFKGDARLLVTASGNNAQLDSDLGRRFIRVRIDPGCEKPQSRDFDFDPLERALAERMRIAWGVLVLIRAHRAAGAPVVGRGGAGFEAWSRLVRDAVLWAGSMGYAEEAGIGRMGDPAASILEGSTVHDPEVEAWGQVLRGLDVVHGRQSFDSAELLRLYRLAEHAPGEGLGDLRDGLLGLPGVDHRGELTALRLGRYLVNRRDRIVGGLVLRQAGVSRTKSSLWRIERVLA